MNDIRVFLAVLLPDEIRATLADVGRKLQASGADMRWVAEDNLHITIKFLGDVRPTAVCVIAQAVQTACEGIEPFAVAITGVGAFMKSGAPGVIWAGMSQGGGRLGLLAEKIDEAISALGFEKEKCPFLAHITFGRARSVRGAAKLQKLLDCLKDTNIGSVKIDSIAVVKSELKPNGPVYSTLNTIGLH